MNPYQIIISFLRLLKDNRSQLPVTALQDLPNLNKKLPEELGDTHLAADEIAAWCKQHKLIDSLERVERGIKSPPPPDPANQELAKTNIYEQAYQEIKQITAQGQNQPPTPSKP